MKILLSILTLCLLCLSGPSVAREYGTGWVPADEKDWEGIEDYAPGKRAHPQLEEQLRNERNRQDRIHKRGAYDDSGNQDADTTHNRGTVVKDRPNCATADDPERCRILREAMTLADPSKRKTR